MACFVEEINAVLSKLHPCKRKQELIVAPWREGPWPEGAELVSDSIMLPLQCRRLTSATFSVPLSQLVLLCGAL